LLANVLCEQTEKFALSTSIMETTARITKEKYGAAEWTRRF
jgi:hypothetical protein